MTIESFVLVGDLHGSVVAARSVLQQFLGKRDLIFLGDYINRGPDPKGVVQMLINAKRYHPKNVTLLRGNHDQSILDFLEGGSEALFLRMGGATTIASYMSDPSTGDLRSELRSAMPPSHLDFFHKLAPFFETEDLFASHCGLDPWSPTVRDVASVALASHPDLFSADLSGLGKTVVCGHYAQRSKKPYIAKNLIVLDTGCGTIPGAPLTALLWPERLPVIFGGADA